MIEKTVDIILFRNNFGAAWNGELLCTGKLNATWTNWKRSIRRNGISQPPLWRSKERKSAFSRVSLLTLPPICSEKTQRRREHRDYVSVISAPLWASCIEKHVRWNSAKKHPGRLQGILFSKAFDWGSIDASSSSTGIYSPTACNLPT